MQAHLAFCNSSRKSFTAWMVLLRFQDLGGMLDNSGISKRLPLLFSAANYCISFGQMAIPL
jgi:hypothetical protein